MKEGDMAGNYYRNNDFWELKLSLIQKKMEVYSFQKCDM
jgi:hypothetical protein